MSIAKNPVLSGFIQTHLSVGWGRLLYGKFEFCIFSGDSCVS